MTKPCVSLTKNGSHLGLVERVVKALGTGTDRAREFMFAMGKTETWEAALDVCGQYVELVPENQLPA